MTPEIREGADTRWKSCLPPLWWCPCACAACACFRVLKNRLALFHKFPYWQSNRQCRSWETMWVSRLFLFVSENLL